MKKLGLLLSGLLLVSTSVLASGYVSSEYEVYDYKTTENNYERVETLVGLNDIMGGAVEIRHRDTYDSSNNLRVRYTYNLTDDFSVRGQYYTDGSKAYYTVTPRYKPFWNELPGMWHMVMADFNKAENKSVTTDINSWLYYTVQQDVIPSLTINNETYIDDITAANQSDYKVDVDMWIDAKVWEKEYNGFKMYATGRVYNWMDVKHNEDQLVHNTGVRAYLGMNKDVTIQGTTITTHLEYMFDKSLDSSEYWNGLEARVTYKF